MLKMIVLQRLDAWVRLKEIWERGVGRRRASWSSQDGLAESHIYSHQQRHEYDDDDDDDASLFYHREEDSHSAMLHHGSFSRPASNRIRYLSHSCLSKEQYLQLNLMLPSMQEDHVTDTHTSVVWEFADEYACVEERYIDERGNVWSDVRWDATNSSGDSLSSLAQASSSTNHILNLIQHLKRTLEFTDSQLASWIIIALKQPHTLHDVLEQQHQYSHREIRTLWSSLIAPLLVQLFVVDTNRNTCCLIVHLIYLILIREEFNVEKFSKGTRSAHAEDSNSSAPHQHHSSFTMDFRMFFEYLSPVHYGAASAAPPSARLVHFLSALTEMRQFGQHWRHDANDEAWPLWTESPLHVSHAYDSDMTDLEEEIRRRELLALEMWMVYCAREQLNEQCGETIPAKSSQVELNPSTIQPLLINLIQEEFQLPQYQFTSTAWQEEPQFVRYKNLALYDGAITMPNGGTSKHSAASSLHNAHLTWKLSYNIHHCALNSDIMSYVYTGTTAQQRDILLRHIGEKTNQLIEYIHQVGSAMRAEQLERRHGIKRDEHVPDVPFDWPSRMFQFVVNGANVDGKLGVFQETSLSNTRAGTGLHIMLDSRLTLGALTPLNVAIMLGQVDIVQYLVENCHADVNHETPLLVAIKARAPSVVSYLLETQRVDLTEYASTLGATALQNFDFGVFGVLMMRVGWVRAQYYEEYLRRCESGSVHGHHEVQQEVHKERSTRSAQPDQNSPRTSPSAPVSPAPQSPILSPLVTLPPNLMQRRMSSPLVHEYSQQRSNSPRLPHAPASPSTAPPTSPAVSMHNQQTSTGGMTPQAAPQGFPQPYPYQKSNQIQIHYQAQPQAGSFPPIIDINAPEHPFNQQQDDFLEEGFSTDDDGFSTGNDEDEDTLDRLSALKPAPLYISPSTRAFAKPLMQFAVKKKKKKQARSAPVVDEEDIQSVEPDDVF